MDLKSKEIAKLKKKYSKRSLDGGSAGFKSKVLTSLPTILTTILLKRFLKQSDYKLKRESIKFFQLCGRAYGERKFRKCRRLLRIAIDLLGSKFPISYEMLLLNAISTTSKNSNNRGLVSDSVLLATKQLEPAIFDATGWYQLSRGLFCLGYFRAALVARENSLDLSIVEGSIPSASATAVSRAVEAHLERLELEPVRRILTLDCGLSPRSSESLSRCLLLLEGNFSKNSVEDQISGNGPELLFRNLVNGKVVALVGPGNPHGEYGIEIDSADTVARVKFVGAENLPAPKYHGERCSVAYQAAISSLEAFSCLGIDISWYADIELFVSTGAKSEFLMKPVLNVDTSIPIYRTTAISGIVFLYHLIYCSPKSLKIYGFDFRSIRKQYSNSARDFYATFGLMLGHSYPGFDSEDVPAWIIARDFSEHDFVSNFRFAQNLHKAGLFDIEPFGKSVIELTSFQYVERLEEMLGGW